MTFRRPFYILKQTSFIPHKYGCKVWRRISISVISVILALPKYSKPTKRMMLLLTFLSWLMCSIHFSKEKTGGADGREAASIKSGNAVGIGLLGFAQDLRQTGSEDATGGNGFTVQPYAVTHFGFDGMAESVAEIKPCSDALLGFVLGNNNRPSFCSNDKRLLPFFLGVAPSGRPCFLPTKQKIRHLPRHRI